MEKVAENWGAAGSNMRLKTGRDSEGWRRQQGHQDTAGDAAGTWSQWAGSAWLRTGRDGRAARSRVSHLRTYRAQWQLIWMMKGQWESEGQYRKVMNDRERLPGDSPRSVDRIREASLPCPWPGGKARLHLGHLPQTCPQPSWFTCPAPAVLHVSRPQGGCWCPRTKRHQVSREESSWGWNPVMQLRFIV